MTNTINKLRIQFLVIPLVVFSLTPFVNDSLGIPKLISLIFGTILVVIALTNQISNFSKFCYIPIFLSTYYMFLQVINPIDLSKFLLGAYSRNGGFIDLFCLTMIFVLVASQVKYYNKLCSHLLYSRNPKSTSISISHRFWWENYTNFS